GLTGDARHTERVHGGCERQQDEGPVNYAIGELVPWFLRPNLIPTSARGHQAPYYDGAADTVWASPQRLADAWRLRSGLSGRERQLRTEDAIRAELKANGVDLKGKPKWVERNSDGKGQKARYCALEGALSALIMDKVG